MSSRRPMSLLLLAAASSIVRIFNFGGNAELVRHTPGKHAKGRVKSRRARIPRSRGDFRRKHSTRHEGMRIARGKRAISAERIAAAFAIARAHRMCRLPRKYEQAAARSYRWRGRWMGWLQ